MVPEPPSAAPMPAEYRCVRDAACTPEATERQYVLVPSSAANDTDRLPATAEVTNWNVTDWTRSTLPVLFRNATSPPAAGVAAGMTRCRIASVKSGGIIDLHYGLCTVDGDRTPPATVHSDHSPETYRTRRELCQHEPDVGRTPRAVLAYERQCGRPVGLVDDRDVWFARGLTQTHEPVAGLDGFHRARPADPQVGGVDAAQADAQNVRVGLVAQQGVVLVRDHRVESRVQCRTRRPVTGHRRIRYGHFLDQDRHDGILDLIPRRETRRRPRKVPVVRQIGGRVGFRATALDLERQHVVRENPLSQPIGKEVANGGRDRAETNRLNLVVELAGPQAYHTRSRRLGPDALNERLLR